MSCPRELLIDDWALAFSNYNAKTMKIMEKL